MRVLNCVNHARKEALGEEEPGKMIQSRGIKAKGLVEIDFRLQKQIWRGTLRGVPRSREWIAKNYVGGPRGKNIKN